MTRTLHQALAGGDTDDVVCALLERGADPKSKCSGFGSKSPQSALHLALKLKRSERVVRALLASGADALEKLPNSRGLVHVAAVHGAPCGAVRALVESGADATLEDSVMRTPFDYAVALGGRDDLAALLADAGGAGVWRRNGSGNTILHVLSGRGATDSVRRVLRFAESFQEGTLGDFVNLPGSYGRTAAHFAARSSHAQVFLDLLGSGASLGAEDDFGMTVSFAAMVSGSKATALAALGAGADVNEHCSGTQALLFCISRSDGAEYIRFLVDQGADVNFAGARNGLRPLHAACLNFCMDPATVRVLLESGADVRALATLGYAHVRDEINPLAQVLCQGARSAASEEVVRDLLAAGTPVPRDRSSCRALRNCSASVVVSVLRRGMPILVFEPRAYLYFDAKVRDLLARVRAAGSWPEYVLSARLPYALLHRAASRLPLFDASDKKTDPAPWVSAMRRVFALPETVAARVFAFSVDYY
ncbi:MAG: ankyrin repeat domain-containing protein [Ilumatobacteraceae bacterium]